MQQTSRSLLLANLLEIRNHLLTLETSHLHWLEGIHPNYQDSARNLVHYLALRTFNLHDIQSQLSDLGLSSLSHSEGSTLANLEQVIRLLSLLEGQAFEGSDNLPPQAASYSRSRTTLQTNKRRLFGQTHRTNHTRIMVTLPSEAAEDRSLVAALLDAGMDLARINCSHDGEEAWANMIRFVREEAASRNRRCPVYMDLAGPKLRTGPVEGIPGKKGEGYLVLHVGDSLEVTGEPLPGNNARYDEAGNLLSVARISVSLPEVIEDVKTGDAIFFDDGTIGGVVMGKRQGLLELRITQAGLEGSKLRAEKGINLPDTQLRLPSLTPDDLASLPFVAQEADIVGYSFVRRAGDVAFLQARLRELGKPDLGIVLKIETREAFEQLPFLLLQGMKSPSLGLMIARGDLAVEVGWERSSEVQEELLWICEAGHVPTIWATQVLEKLAKKGVASRAEITDAAMASRAECVMLNKGPYIADAVRTLDNIISRMEFHQEKKKGMLRPLQVARALFLPGTNP